MTGCPLQIVGLTVELKALLTSHVQADTTIRRTKHVFGHLNHCQNNRMAQWLLCLDQDWRILGPNSGHGRLPLCEAPDEVPSSYCSRTSFRTTACSLYKKTKSPRRPIEENTVLVYAHKAQSCSVRSQSSMVDVKGIVVKIVIIVEVISNDTGF